MLVSCNNPGSALNLCFSFLLHNVCTLLQAIPPNSALVTEDRDVMSKLIRNQDRVEWSEQKVSLRQLPKIYLKLSKYRLTGSVHVTSSFSSQWVWMQLTSPLKTFVCKFDSLKDTKAVLHTGMISVYSTAFILGSQRLWSYIKQVRVIFLYKLSRCMDDRLKKYINMECMRMLSVVQLHATDVQCGPVPHSMSVICNWTTFEHCPCILGFYTYSTCHV